MTQGILAKVQEISEKEGVKFKKPLSADERMFMRNEVYVGKTDFRYWAERYANVMREGLGQGKIQFWESQLKLLEAISKAEEEAWDAQEHGFTVDGIRITLNKARQLGATAVSRLLTMHRLTLWPDHRAMGASVDEDKIQELYDRDWLIYDNLPFFLKPHLGFNEKRAHIYFDRLNSRILYQQSQQKTGLGQGRQFELGHLTECASFPVPEMIPHDFFPTLPQSINTLCILESTPQGRDNWWYEFTNEVRDGHWPGWKYIFVPWYIESKKYRRTPPTNWNPSKLTLAHAQKVLESSPEVTGKKTVLTKEQLFWYETTRWAYQREGKLAIFLTNYCATHEESFQHIQQSALPTEVIEDLRLQTVKGIPYEME